jgi:hypothetical protein
VFEGPGSFHIFAESPVQMFAFIVREVVMQTFYNVMENAMLGMFAFVGFLLVFTFLSPFAIALLIALKTMWSWVL